MASVPDPTVREIPLISAISFCFNSQISDFRAYRQRFIKDSMQDIMYVEGVRRVRGLCN